MKRNTIILSAILAVLSLVSCNKDNAGIGEEQNKKEEYVNLIVDMRLPQPSTKVVDVNIKEESVINNIKVLVYDYDDVLTWYRLALTNSDELTDAQKDSLKTFPKATYGKFDGSFGILQCTRGKKLIAAFANEPKLDANTTLTDLIGYDGTLMQSLPGNIIMEASDTVTINENTSIEMEAKREIARFHVKKVTNSLEGKDAGKDIVLERMFLANVSGDFDDWNGFEHTPSVYYNFGNDTKTILSNLDGEAKAYTVDEIGATIKHGESYEEHQHYFYSGTCYTNSNSYEDGTQLVLEGYVGDDPTLRYWSISFDESHLNISIAGNHSYTFNEIIIKSEGSYDIDPDKTYDAIDFKGGLTVTDWSTGEVSVDVEPSTVLITLIGSSLEQWTEEELSLILG